MKLWEKIRRNSALGILVIVFAAALWQVLRLQIGAEAGGRKILRIAHWQMESGVGIALDEAIRQYEMLHPDVRLEQIQIGERGYGTWVTTRLIGGTAPDILVMGQIETSLLLPLLQRYCLPLSDEIEKPNPYNAGTPLEGVPWKDTYYDDMAGGYVKEVLQYYSVPSSAFTLRVFYNKELFKKATGLDAPPADFREFIQACEKIKAYDPRLIPIAGAGKYNARILWDRFDQGVSSSLLPITDVNRDSEVTMEESIIALTGGTVDLKDPRIEAMFKGRDYYNKQFQPAFFSADRMDSAFLFLQQHALMIASGSWDASSYAGQADFEIGVCDFPLPGKDDPEFGKFVEGPAVEELVGGFSFSVNRLSPNKSVALDFLRFFTSQKINETFNRQVKWIPMIRGNKPDAFTAPFWPNLDGVKAGITLEGGAANSLQLAEILSLQAAGRLDFPEFIKRYSARYIANADVLMRTDIVRSEQLAATQDEFAKTLERMTGESGNSALIFEGQISRRHDITELSERYEEARQQSPLPKP